MHGTAAFLFLRLQLQHHLCLSFGWGFGYTDEDTFLHCPAAPRMITYNMEDCKTEQIIHTAHELHYTALVGPTRELVEYLASSSNGGGNNAKQQ